MKFFKRLPLLLVILATEANATNISVSGDVSGEWSEDTVFVTADIQIPYDQSLTIKAGCNILFTGYYSLQVFGHLTAIGDSSHLIHFNRTDTTGFSEQSPAGAWAGLVMRNTPDISKFHYCVFQYTKGGNTIDLEYGYTQFRYCQFYNNRTQYIFFCWQFKNEIRNCVIARNAGLAMIRIGGRLFDTTRFENNTIINNTGYAFAYDGYVKSMCIVANNIFWNNSTTNGTEIYYGPYSSYGFDTSSLVLRNCIIKNGSRLPFFNSTCFEGYPLFKDTSNFDFSLQWSHFPVNDTTRSIAIDNGYYLSPHDPDSTRSDIGAIAFYRPDGPSHTWVTFSMDTTLGYQSNHTVNFTNLSNNPDPGTSWLWSFGDGDTSASLAPTHTYTSSGKFTVKLIAKDPGGHTDSLVLQNAITVLPGTRIKEGEVSGIWDKSHSPYYVYGDVFVGQTGKLEIQEGVVVQFMGPFSLDVFGSMVVKGKIQDTVRFEAYDTTGMTLYKGMNIDFPFADFQRSKGWGGIHFVSDSSRTDTCIVEFARISDVRIGNPYSNRYRGALKLHKVKMARVENSLFINNFTTPDYHIDEHLDTSAYSYQTAGISGYATNPDIEQNRFENLYQIAPGAIYLFHSDSARVAGNSFFDIADDAAALEGIKAYRFVNNTFDRVGSICLRLRDADFGEQRTQLNEVDGNMFSNSGKGVSGGDIYKIRFSYNVFRNNVADIDVALALWGDSLYVSQNLFYGNRVTGNISNVGGTCISILLVRSKTAVVANNTIVDNYGSYFQPNIYADDSLRLYNNIVRNRTGIELQGTYFTTSWFFSNFTKSYHNNVRGGYLAGLNNYDEPALFVDSINHNYKLKNRSSSINRGYPDTARLFLYPYDFFGNPRTDTFTRKIDVGFCEYVSHKPSQIALSADTVQENRPPYTAIAKLTADDPDTGDVHEYWLISLPGIANDNNEFMIIGDSLYTAVTFNASQGHKVISVHAVDQAGAYLDTSFLISIKPNVVTGLPPIQLSERYLIHPNPVYNNVITFEPRQQQHGAWSIYSIDGSLLLSGTFKDKTKIDLGSLSRGVYLFKIVDHNAEYCIQLLKL